ncbi:hypothetical protein BZG36_05435, partial [Bifiguratus adelaidae]
MKAYVVERWLKGPEELALRDDVPEPKELKDDECLIDVRAIGLNFFDILMIQGRYQIKPPFPFVPGGEFSGVVMKTGAGVKRFKVGDKVFGSGYSYAERVVASESKMLPMPEGFSFEEAAGLFITYPTSYAALKLRANLQPGETCLVHAAAGGVGIAAVQIAKAFGATVIATAGSAAKLDIAKRNGADHVINYRDKDWTDQVKKLTNGKGVDVVYDPVGMVEESMKIIRWNGRILVIGFAKGHFEKVSLNRVLLKNIALVGLHWGEYAKFEPDRIPEVWNDLFKLFKGRSDLVRPVIWEHVFRFEDVSKGLIAIGGRETYGKVVARVGENSRLDYCVFCVQVISILWQPWYPCPKMAAAGPARRTQIKELLKSDGIHGDIETRLGYNPVMRLSMDDFQMAQANLPTKLYVFGTQIGRGDETLNGILSYLQTTRRLKLIHAETPVTNELHLVRPSIHMRLQRSPIGVAVRYGQILVLEWSDDE